MLPHMQGAGDKLLQILMLDGAHSPADAATEAMASAPCRLLDLMAMPPFWQKLKLKPESQQHGTLGYVTFILLIPMIQREHRRG